MNVDETRSLAEWAEFYGIPLSTFKRWAKAVKKKKPFYRSDSRVIAYYGLGKARRCVGSSKSSGDRNLKLLEERLEKDG